MLLLILTLSLNDDNKSNKYNSDDQW